MEYSNPQETVFVDLKSTATTLSIAASVLHTHRNMYSNPQETEFVDLKIAAATLSTAA